MDSAVVDTAVVDSAAKELNTAATHWPEPQLAITGHELGSNPGRDKRLLSSPKRPYWLWGPPRLLFNGYHGSVRG